MSLPRNILALGLTLSLVVGAMLALKAGSQSETVADPAPKVAEDPTPKTTAPTAPERKNVNRKPADAGGVKEITFDEIKLDMKKEDPFDLSLLTDKVKQLEGKPIRVRGYILPSFQQNGIMRFVLVRDNMECCFGPGALLHDCILVEMVPPAVATFTVRPVSVEGTFSIHEVKDPTNGKHLAIYHLDGKKVD